jgi:hypothetical protein
MPLFRMTQSTDTDAQAQRFSELVRAFTPVCASRYAKLLPFKDNIIELRQKGASYRLIRELLATIDVSVAVDTIGNFVREVVEQRPPARPSRRRRPVRAVSEPSSGRSLPTPSKPQFLFTVAPPVEQGTRDSHADAVAPAAAARGPAERPRTRGPRIADPANL